MRCTSGRGWQRRGRPAAAPPHSCGLACCRCPLPQAPKALHAPHDMARRHRPQAALRWPLSGGWAVPRARVRSLVDRAAPWCPRRSRGSPRATWPRDTPRAGATCRRRTPSPPSTRAPSCRRSCTRRRPRPRTPRGATTTRRASRGVPRMAHDHTLAGGRLTHDLASHGAALPMAHDHTFAGGRLTHDLACLGRSPRTSSSSPRASSPGWSA